MSKTKKRTNIIFIILYLLFVVAVFVGGYFLISNLIVQNRQYLAFVVTDEEQNIIQTSNNNVLKENKTYRFNVKYVYPKDKQGSTKFNVDIIALSSNEKLTYTYGDDIYTFSGERIKGELLKDMFKVKINEGYFEFTVTLVSNNFRELQGCRKKEWNWSNLFDNDSFKIYITSFNKKSVIEYAFHFTSDEEVQEITFDTDDIDFVANGKVEIPIHNIEIENGNINFGTDGKVEIPVHSIEIENDDIDFVADGKVEIPVHSIEIENGDIDFVGGMDKPPEEPKPPVDPEAPEEPEKPVEPEEPEPPKPPVERPKWQKPELDHFVGAPEGAGYYYYYSGSSVYLVIGLDSLCGYAIIYCGECL